MKPEYEDNAKLCCMNTDSFIVHVKTEDVYVDIAQDVEIRFDTLNYDVQGLLPIDKDMLIRKYKEMFNEERNQIPILQRLSVK